MEEKYLEEFEEGDRTESPRRYISESDLRRFLDLVGLREPLFDSKRYVQENTPYDDLIVPGYLTMSFSLGLFMRSGWLDQGLAFLGIQDLSFDAPVQVGDEIRTSVEVIETRHTSNEEHGIVTLEWRTCTDDDVVMTMTSDHLIKRRPRCS